jgi:hypothetical protein
MIINCQGGIVTSSEHTLSSMNSQGGIVMPVPRTPSAPPGENSGNIRKDGISATVGNVTNRQHP